jgi:hypothetical protein
VDGNHKFTNGHNVPHCKISEFGKIDKGGDNDQIRNPSLKYTINKAKDITAREKRSHTAVAIFYVNSRSHPCHVGTFSITLRYFVILHLLSCSNLYSQIIEIEWEMTYGGNGDDRANSILQSTDSGFVVAGYSNSVDGDITSPYGDHDYWITKLDSIGSLQWQRSYGGSEDDWCYDICHGVNGGYLLVGQTQSIDGDVTENNGGIDYWIVSIDSLGEIIWQ